MSPALSAWIASPDSGVSTTATVSAASATSSSDCPTPTVSMSVVREPHPSRISQRSPVRAASPPRLPRVAMLRMKTSGSVACSPIRTRSPRIAPPVKGLVGSTATTPTWTSFERRRRAYSATSVDFPAPGGPVTPTRGAAGRLPKIEERLGFRRPVLDEAHRARDRLRRALEDRLRERADRISRGRGGGGGPGSILHPGARLDAPLVMVLDLLE